MLARPVSVIACIEAIQCAMNEPASRDILGHARRLLRTSEVRELSAVMAKKLRGMFKGLYGALVWAKCVLAKCVGRASAECGWQVFGVRPLLEADHCKDLGHLLKLSLAPQLRAYRQSLSRTLFAIRLFPRTHMLKRFYIQLYGRARTKYARPIRLGRLTQLWLLAHQGSM